jgi:hypothetical protein
VNGEENAASWIDICVGACSACFRGGQSATNPNDEGLTDTSVFHRRVGVAPTKAAPADEYVPPVALLFDDGGHSNELIVTLSYSNTTALRQIVPALPDGVGRKVVEQEVVKAVRLRDRNADLSLQSPVASWHLTHRTRLDDDQRAELSLDHPRERLEQYIRLRYGSVAAALQAEERLKSHAALATVTNNRRVSVSWAPNDPYFPVQSEARLYQWGLHELNLSAAWDVSTGHG